jgi:hypothetical protein
MNRKEYNKYKTKLEKILTEFVEVFKEVGHLEVEHTWKIDDCNSVTYKGILYTFWEDKDELCDCSFLTRNLSKAFEYFIDWYDITNSDMYYDCIVDPILKKYKDQIKKPKQLLKKFEKNFDENPDYIVDALERGVFDIEELLEMALEDVDIEDEILYSYDNNNWVKHGSAEEFIEDEGLVDGVDFYIKTNGKVKKHNVVVEKVVYNEIGFK